jgi:hypothetical protein
MRISYQRDGGIAYLPGLSRPLRIDTAALPAAQAAHLEQLVAAANVFDHESAAPPPGAADHYTYTLRVEDGSRHATLRLHDPINAPELRDLVGYLEELRRSLRSLG